MKVFIMKNILKLSHEFSINECFHNFRDILYIQYITINKK